MRASSSRLEPMAAPPCPTKAERRYPSFPTPVSRSPTLAAVRPGTGSPVAVYTASNPPKGLVRAGKRRMVMSCPSHSTCISPDMGAPDQGA